MYYDIRGFTNLANAVITQAIKDLVDRNEEGDYMCSPSEFLTAKTFLKNNCGFYGDFFDLNKKKIEKAVQKYKKRKRYLKSKRQKVGI